MEGNIDLAVAVSIYCHLIGKSMEDSASAFLSSHQKLLPHGTEQPTPTIVK